MSRVNFKQNRARINVDLPGVLYDRMSEVFPHGTRNQIIVVFMEHLVKLVEAHGLGVVWAMMEGKFHPFEPADGTFAQTRKEVSGNG